MSKVGFIVGRFQPVHLGHLQMIRHAKNYCDTLVILIGSSQESRTEKNPFTFEERAYFLRGALGYTNDSNNVFIVPLPDAGIGNGTEWGKYVLNTLYNYTGYKDNLVTFSGYEERRRSWYEGLGVDDIMIDKRKDLSATYVREKLREYNNGLCEKTSFSGILSSAIWSNENLLKDMARIVVESTNPATDSI